MKAFLCGILALVLLGFTVYSQEVDNTLNNSPGEYVYFSQDGNGGSSRSFSFCDDFDIPNTTIIPGWTEQKGDWTILNHKLQSPLNANWDYISVDNSILTDGCITGRATYGSQTALKFIGLVARGTSNSSNILFKIQDNNVTGHWDSYWIYIGMSPMIYAVTGQNFGTDAFIQMQFAGSSVTVRIDVNRDGTWDHSHTATVPLTTPGLCAVGAYSSYATMDDYCCGDTCDYPLVPLSDYALYIALALIAGFLAFRVYRRA